MIQWAFWIALLKAYAWWDSIKTQTGLPQLQLSGKIQSEVKSQRSIRPLADRSFRFWIVPRRGICLGYDTFAFWILTFYLIIMGLPGQRRTKSSKRRRAAHFALKRQQLTACAKCKKMILPHAVCQHCGTYRGRVVMVTASMKRLKRLRRRQKQSKSSEPG